MEDALPEMRDTGGPTCTPSCGERECGPDLCGGTCGNCNPGDMCSAGRCENTCPSGSSSTSDGDCACDRGYTLSNECTSCVPDPDGDGCPANSVPGGGACVCTSGYVRSGCGCVEESCHAGTAYWCGECIVDLDGDGCPTNASRVAGACACDPGMEFDASGCHCAAASPDFTHPAFEASSCAGVPMSYAAASARWRAGEGSLGSYQFVFRKRMCDHDDVCGPWAEVPLSEISWATRASGLLGITSSEGVLKVDLRHGVCREPGWAREYLAGARCTGVGATLTCESYRRPGICASSGAPEYWEFEGERLQFYGELKSDCARLVAEISNEYLGGSHLEGEVGVLVRF